MDNKSLQAAIEQIFKPPSKDKVRTMHTTKYGLAGLLNITLDEAKLKLDIHGEPLGIEGWYVVKIKNGKLI